MKIIVICSLLFSLSALSKENAFRLNVGSLASGASYLSEDLDLKSDGSQETETYHISLGYLRHLGLGFQAVGNASYKYYNTKNDSLETEDNETVLELGALYNLQKDLRSSFYVGALYYYSKRFDGSYTDAADTETEGTLSGVELTIGKRFNLIENLSYVVSVDYITGLTFGDDLDDTYDGGSIVRVNLATFEYYF